MGIQGLAVKELEELRDDIKMHLDLDRATQTHIDYWEVSIIGVANAFCLTTVSAFKLFFHFSQRNIKIFGWMYAILDD